MPRWMRSLFGAECDYYRPRHRIIYYHSSDSYTRLPSSGTRVVNHSQYCGACGKFRSPKWQARNPSTGNSPGLCKKCAGKSTSEEEPNPHKRCKKHGRRYCVRCYDSSDEILSATEIRRLGRRISRPDLTSHHKTHSVRGSRSASTDRINVIVQNNGRDCKPRVRTLSSSDENIHLVRRLSIDRSPRRRLSSFEKDILDRYLPKRRSLRRAR